MNTNAIEPTIITTQSDEIVVTTKTDYMKFVLGYDGRKFHAERITDEDGNFDRWELLVQSSQTTPFYGRNFVYIDYPNSFDALDALLIKTYDEDYGWTLRDCGDNTIFDTEETILKAMQEDDEDGYFASKLARLREATA
jgi:hypothetical protein